jgi:glutaredoxin
MNATIWTQEGCQACREEADILKAEGYRVSEIVVDDPQNMDRDAFAQLNVQDGIFPVVRTSTFRIPAGVSKKMEW